MEVHYRSFKTPRWSGPGSDLSCSKDIGVSSLFRTLFPPDAVCQFAASPLPMLKASCDSGIGAFPALDFQHHKEDGL